MASPRQLLRGRSGLLLKVIAAAYIIALTALPSAHHDLLCHLKSSTHCTTCHLGTSGDGRSGEPAVAALVLSELGPADTTPRLLNASCVPTTDAGRAPPVPSKTPLS